MSGQVSNTRYSLHVGFLNRLEDNISKYNNSSDNEKENLYKIICADLKYLATKNIEWNCLSSKEFSKVIGKLNSLDHKLNSVSRNLFTCLGAASSDRQAISRKIKETVICLKSKIMKPELLIQSEISKQRKNIDNEGPNIKLIKRLLKRGDVNVDFCIYDPEDNIHRTLLSYAVKKGHTEVVLALLDADADISKYGSRLRHNPDSLPFETASKSNNDEILELIERKRPEAHEEFLERRRLALGKTETHRNAKAKAMNAMSQSNLLDPGSPVHKRVSTPKALSQFIFDSNSVRTSTSDVSTPKGKDSPKSASSPSSSRTSKKFEVGKFPSQAELRLIKDIQTGDWGLATASLNLESVSADFLAYILLKEPELVKNILENSNIKGEPIQRDKFLNAFFAKLSNGVDPTTLASIINDESLLKAILGNAGKNEGDSPVDKFIRALLLRVVNDVSLQGKIARVGDKEWIQQSIIKLVLLNGADPVALARIINEETLLRAILEKAGEREGDNGQVDVFIRALLFSAINDTSLLGKIIEAEDRKWIQDSIVKLFNQKYYLFINEKYFTLNEKAHNYDLLIELIKNAKKPWVYLLLVPYVHQVAEKSKEVANEINACVSRARSNEGLKFEQLERLKRLLNSSVQVNKR